MQIDESACFIIYKSPVSPRPERGAVEMAVVGKTRRSNGYGAIGFIDVLPRKRFLRPMPNPGFKLFNPLLDRATRITFFERLHRALMQIELDDNERLPRLVVFD